MEDPKKALQEIIDEIFDGEAPPVVEDEATMALACGIQYVTQIAFDRRDIMEHQANGTLDTWVKLNTSQALMSLAELIDKKIAEIELG